MQSTMICRSCGEEKPRTSEFFTPRKATARRSAGLATQCKECRKASRREASLQPKEVPPEKTCSKCGASKPSGSYGRSRHAADGLGGVCKECRCTGLPGGPRSRAFVDVPEGYKRCTQCDQPKPMTREHFYAGIGYGGLNTRCIECARTRSRSPEAIATRKAKYQERSGDPAFRAANRLRVRAYADKQLAESPQEFRSRRRQALRTWRTRHSETSRLQARVAASRRRRLLEGAGGEHCAEDILALLDQQGCRCAYCAVDLNVTGYHVDHVIPVIRGGGNGVDNLALACPLCNQSKSDRLLDEWTKRPTASDSLAHAAYLRGENPDWRPPWRYRRLKSWQSP